MKHAGNALRKRRSDLGHSVDEASLACAIPKDLIHAIEDGDLEKLPHRAFAIGFLRSYCHYLDLPPEGFITELQESLSKVRYIAPSSLNAKTCRAPRLRLPRLGLRIPKELQTWLAVCGLLLLGWFTYSAVIRPTADINQGHAQAASIETHLGGQD